MTPEYNPADLRRHYNLHTFRSSHVGAGDPKKSRLGKFARAIYNHVLAQQDGPYGILPQYWAGSSIEETPISLDEVTTLLCRVNEFGKARDLLARFEARPVASALLAFLGNPDAERIGELEKLTGAKIEELVPHKYIISIRTAQDPAIIARRVHKPRELKAYPGPTDFNRRYSIRAQTGIAEIDPQLDQGD